MAHREDRKSRNRADASARSEHARAESFGGRTRQKGEAKEEKKKKKKRDESRELGIERTRSAQLLLERGSLLSGRVGGVGGGSLLSGGGGGARFGFGSILG